MVDHDSSIDFSVAVAIILFSQPADIWLAANTQDQRRLDEPFLGIDLQQIFPVIGSVDVLQQFDLNNVGSYIVLILIDQNP